MLGAYRSAAAAGVTAAGELSMEAESKKIDYWPTYFLLDNDYYKNIFILNDALFYVFQQSLWAANRHNILQS
jgi:hypothetical protein